LQDVIINFTFLSGPMTKTERTEESGADRMTGEICPL